MAVTPQADFVPESRVLAIPVSALVAMRSAKQDFTDPSGNLLGLGAGDLFDLKLPPFQRGLQWDKERLQEFHDSLIQGWPFGVITIAIQASTLINAQTGQRRYTLSLIDGQQRSWALSQLIKDFWTQPWFMFASQKWDVMGPAVGPISDAALAAGALAATLGVKQIELEDAVRVVSKEKGAECFTDYIDFLDSLRDRMDVEAAKFGKPARNSARDLCAAILAQFDALNEIPVPTTLLSEALEAQLPTIFQRLNEGVPLKGYDLLAAMWESKRLVSGKAKATPFLNDVLSVAEQRIRGTYDKLGSGYQIDPNLEPLQVTDLSLFDLLYYLGSKMANHPPFSTSSDVLAFQTSALIFRGSIGKVDDDLRDAFPGSGTGPDITTLPTLYEEAAEHLTAALKPLMDVTSSNLTVKGRVGLTPAVVYLATFLTHHTRVEHKTGTRLVLRRRGGSADDRIVAPGAFLTSSERLSLLKANLPAWYLHDSLTSIFAGSRAYEAAKDRVWASFRGTGKKGDYHLNPSNEMLQPPSLSSLADALDKLWETEIGVEKTPIRRRVSDSGSVLMRAAYSHLHVHDYVIDHVMPYSKGRSSAMNAKSEYPLNHVANLMPLEPSINGKRNDQDWDVFIDNLSAPEANRVAALLMISPSEAKADRLKDLANLTEFLRLRYRVLVAQALTNLQHADWLAMTPKEQKKFLSKIAK